jgi:hypothetical protein
LPSQAMLSGGEPNWVSKNPWKHKLWCAQQDIQSLKILVSQARQAPQGYQTDLFLICLMVVLLNMKFCLVLPCCLVSGSVFPYIFGIQLVYVGALHNLKISSLS